jgi:hypothetical protein
LTVHNPERVEGEPPEGAEEQVLDIDGTPGVGGDLLKSLPPDAVVAYRGEPTASERAMLCWPMSDQERQDFGAEIERVGNSLRGLGDHDIDRLLDELGQETERLELPLEVQSEEPPGSQDLPEERAEGASSSSGRGRGRRRQIPRRIFVRHL